MSDDKTKNKAERKQAQIDHAPHTSPKAKLVKLADKIYNLQDLNRVPPKGWGERRSVINLSCNDMYCVMMVLYLSVVVEPEW